mgnify:CR=1 FL=1
MIDLDIILPTYNSKKYIEEAINSVLNQTFRTWKLIIIDDGSTDSTIELAKKFLADNRIKIKKLKKNKGQAFCRNLALRYSNSKYIAFIDADDIWEKNKLKKQIQFMEDSNLDFSYTDFISFKEINGIKKFNKEINLPEKFTYGSFIKNTSICTSSMIIRRKKIGSAKFLKTVSCDDYFFKCKVLKNCGFAKKLGEKLTFYRISKNSVQGNKLKNVYSVWYINKRYNKMNFISNIFSLLSISFNSIKKYGFK